MSLGIAENFSALTFGANTFLCRAGGFGYENETEAEVKTNDRWTVE